MFIKLKTKFSLEYPLINTKLFFVLHSILLYFYNELVLHLIFFYNE